MAQPPHTLQLVSVFQADETNSDDAELSSNDMMGLVNSKKNHMRRLDPSEHLPMELIEHIFRLAQKGSGSLNPLWDGPTSSTVSLSHVSRRWRQIALGLPRLWTCIDVDKTSLPGLSVFVRRSQAVPLCVILTKYCGMKIEFLQSIAHRIQTFRFRRDSFEGWTEEKLHALYGLDLPELVDCTLFGVQDLVPSWPAFLTDGSQKLKRLQLDSVLAMPLVSFPLLTRLEIHPSNIDVFTILEILSQCILLEEVKLHEVIWPIPEKPRSALPVAKLDRLVSLNVASAEQDVLALFISKVQLNPMAAINISMLIETNSPVTEALSMKLSQLNAVRAVTTLYIDGDDTDTPISIIGVAGKSLPATHLEIFHAQALFYERIPCSVFDMFPLAQITELWLGRLICESYNYSSLAVQDTAISDVLRRLPALRTLAFHLENIGAFSSVLSRQVSPSVSPSFLCPRLVNVRVCWAITAEFGVTPQRLSRFAIHLSQSRPTVGVYARVYAGSKKTSFSSLSTTNYSIITNVPYISKLSDSTMNPSHHRLNWEICFSSEDSDYINVSSFSDRTT